MRKSMLLFSLFFYLGQSSFCQSVTDTSSRTMQQMIADSLMRVFAQKGYPASFLDKATMSTPALSALPKGYNPHLNIQMLDSSELLTVLSHDTSAAKSVLLWACWSDAAVTEMLKNKYLFDTKNYAIYLVSADINNDRQRDTINSFVTYLGVSDRVYQIRSALDMSDMQNGKGIDRFLSSMTPRDRGPSSKNACAGLPYAIIYDRHNKMIAEMYGHFNFSELGKYTR
ncbi:MAG: hypothetical protein JWO03_1824 [Bacteroidetes bacterium]|nr:hypothetical protein [Bacteroidota bacterium]